MHKTEKILKNQNLPKMTKKRYYLNSSLYGQQFELIVKKRCAHIQNAVQNGFTAKLYQTVKEEILPDLYKIVFKKAGGRILPNLFHEVRIILKLKPKKRVCKEIKL